MNRAYCTAYDVIASSITATSLVLDCGANDGWIFDLIKQRCEISPSQYHGIEWNHESQLEAVAKGLNVIQGDLNKGLPQENESYTCVFATSVLEHLLFPCRFIRECHRVLRPGGRLILLTPNISTYFTAALILLGKMPSSGPHPDSDWLIKNEEVIKVSSDKLLRDSETDTPTHRHLVVFSYRVLRRYLQRVGFSSITGFGFGLYPFPKFMQPALEKLDPYHCHQMVFVAEK